MDKKSPQNTTVLELAETLADNLPLRKL